MREWPHILFLALGFLFLIHGAGKGKCRMFGAAGLAAGLGYLIRPECAQLVLYGTVWILIRPLPLIHQMGRPKLFCALSILLIGFAIPAAPYTIVMPILLNKCACLSHFHLKKYKPPLSAKSFFRDSFFCIFYEKTVNQAGNEEYLKNIYFLLTNTMGHSTL